jgi:hypothetical protein
MSKNADGRRRFLLKNLAKSASAKATGLQAPKNRCWICSNPENYARTDPNMIFSPIARLMLTRLKELGINQHGYALAKQAPHV